MNWVKKVFGKRDWEIVYSVQCQLNRTDILSGLNVKTDGGYYHQSRPRT